MLRLDIVEAETILDALMKVTNAKKSGRRPCAFYLIIDPVNAAIFMQCNNFEFKFKIPLRNATEGTLEEMRVLSFDPVSMKQALTLAKKEKIKIAHFEMTQANGLRICLQLIKYDIQLGKTLDAHHLSDYDSRIIEDEIKSEYSISVSAKSLFEIANIGIPLITKSKNIAHRYQLESMQIRTHSNNTDLVFTDGHRLVMSRDQKKAYDRNDHDINVKIEMLGVLNSILKKTDSAALETSDVKFTHTITEKHDLLQAYVTIQLWQATIVFRTWPEARHSFPDYTRIFPKETKSGFSVNRKNLKPILDTFKTLGRKTIKLVALDSQLTCTDIEDTEMTMPVTCNNRDPQKHFTTIVDIDYLTTMLKDGPCDDIRLEQADALDPIAVFFETKGTTKIQGLIMPCREHII